MTSCLSFCLSLLLGLFLASVLSKNEKKNETQESKEVQEAKEAKQIWYKGTFHIHTLWSDGNALPEIAVMQYKETGYHFVCITDHNIFQSDQLRFLTMGSSTPLTDDIRKKFSEETSSWRPLPPDSVIIQDAISQFGKRSLKWKMVEDLTFFRMKTFTELEQMFNEEGRFVLIPGFELSSGTPDGLMCHLNLINVRQEIPPVSKETIQQTLLVNSARVKKFYRSNEPYLLVVNHPIWRFYDISPIDILEHTRFRFFELNNNGMFPFARPDIPYFFHPDAWTPEKFWDIVNAFRSINHQPLLIALGTDDRHSYTMDHFNTILGPHSWSYVKTEKLTPVGIVQAVQRGDIYCSNGLEFESIIFDQATGTLSVKVKSCPGFDLRIEFFGTKKEFSSSYRTIECSIPTLSNLKRKIDIFSDEIGIVLKTVNGAEASYTLQEDDLYVRARVITIPVCYDTKGKMNPRPAAWTQAFQTNY